MVEFITIAILLLAAVLVIYFTSTRDVNGKLVINWYLVSYVVVSLLVLGSVVGFLWARDQPIAAVITGLLLLLVVTFFGLRWFHAANKAAQPSCGAPPTAGSSAPQTIWPPSVNLCPDFLVAYQDSNGQVLCNDVNNTYGLKTANEPGLLSGLTINGASGQSAYLLMNPAVGSASTDPASSDGQARYPLVNTIQSTIHSGPKGKYLTWEGIFDGTVYTPGNFDTTNI